MRLRNFRLVGERNTSPSEIVGKSSGKAASRKHSAFDRFEKLRHLPDDSC